MSTSLTLTVTPEMAKKMLETCIFENQRQVRVYHVHRLASEMTGGRFWPGTSIHFVQTPTGNVLVDGQHRLAAVIESGMPIEFTVVTHENGYENSVAKAYTRLDAGLPRTVEDKFRAYDLAEKTGFTPTKLQRVASAAQLIAAGYTSPQRGGRLAYDDLQAAIIYYSQYARQYFEIVNESPDSISDSLLRGSSVALGITTLAGCDDVAVAIDFWRGVAFDDGLHVGDPRKMLNRWLIESSERGGHKVGGAKTWQSCRVIASVWDAFIQKREVKLIRLPKVCKELKMERVDISKAAFAIEAAK